MSLAAGTLNRQITVERRAVGEDAAGQPLDGWELVAKLWSNVKGTTGMGTITGLQDNVPAAIEKYSFRIRYRTGLDTAMRVLYDGVVFEIRQIRMDFERKEWTDLVCEEGGTNG